MNILAIDTAQTMGWARYQDGQISSGSVRLKRSSSETEAMKFIEFRKWLISQMKDPANAPDMVFYELVRRHVSTDSAHAYGGYRTLLLMQCSRFDITLRGINVSSIKKFATGKGNAKKDMMIAAAKRAFPKQPIADDNQADALWILACGMSMHKQLDIVPQGAGHEQGVLL